MPAVRPVVLSLSLLGTLLFGAAFAISLVKPLLVERAARELVRIEVEHQVGERIESLSDSRIGTLAQLALQQTDMDIQRAQESLRSGLSQRVNRVVADMLTADCTCRQRIANYLEKAEQVRLSSLLDAREHLTGLIEASYASVRSKLLREYRIFTACNALAFASLGLVTLARRQATAQLWLPALVLIGAVGVTSGLYLFNQDWLHVILFGDYVGLAYASYLLLVIGFLADIAMNRARVTTKLVNGMLNAVGAGASVLPC